MTTPIRRPEEIFAGNVAPGTSAPIRNPDINALRQPLAEAHARQAMELRVKNLDANKANRLADILKAGTVEMSPEDRADKIALLKAYATANPQWVASRQKAKQLATKDSLIAKDPVPTGDPRVDREGESRTTGGSNLVPAFEQNFPSLDDLPADDPLRVKKQRMQEGYDLSGSNLPFFDRRDLAAQPNITRARSEAIKSFFGPRLQSLPPEIREDAFRYDEALGDYVMLLPDKKDPSKYRWTSLEGSGLELGDIADVLNPAEVLSMVGGIVGSTPKGRLFKMGGPKTQQALNGLIGGLGGRVVGELIAMAEANMRTGFVPTWQELKDLGMDSAQIEAFATLTGEFGAKILRTGTNISQELAAKAQGKQAVLAPADEVALHNRSIIQTRADMRMVEKILGKEGQLPVTEGAASRSIDMMEEESHKRANASRSTQRKYNKAVAQEHRTTEEVINKAFGGNKRFLGDLEGTIKNANRHILDANTIVAQTENGTVLFRTRLAGAEDLGLNVNPDASASHWGISGAMLKNEDDNLAGVGLGKKMYLLAVHEANAHGRGLQSGPTVRSDAVRVWDSMKKDGISVEKNPNAELISQVDNDGNIQTFWQAGDEGWVFRTKEPEPISSQLLDRLSEPSFVPTKRGTVREVDAANLSEFIRGSGPSTRRMVEQEISGNTLVRQQWKEALLEDYERTVLADGKVDAAAFKKWKHETASFRDMLFEESEDYFRSGEFGKLRDVVETSRFKEQAKLDTLKKVFQDEKGTINFKDPSQKKLWLQFKGLDPKRRRMAMRVLDHVGIGQRFRAQAREELKNTLITKSKAANFSGLDTWLKENEKIIRDVYGDNTGAQMVGHIKTVRNILRRRSDRIAVKGLAADANPTGLALTRVIFGPLSRAQRFFSAARRGQVRAGAADIGDIITDPDLLKELVAMRGFRVETVAMQRWMQDAGVLGELWWDEERYDINNPAHRKKVAENVKTLYLQELSNDPEVE